jgi:hypothetical protein
VILEGFARIFFLQIVVFVRRINASTGRVYDKRHEEGRL